ncbi:MAG: peptidylprolyl isomerase [SAR324 cluster bacterium]|nr:peptidylprolyl isomerase [SAR324 cluster bacterium]
MTTAQSGNTVKIHYHGTFENGEVFDSSRDSEPLEFTLGAGMVIPGFDSAIVGMKQGDVKDVSIPSDQAYGEKADDLVIVLTKDKYPEDLVPELGMSLHVTLPDGQPFPFLIVDVQESEMTLDGNHPLAGKTLNFNLELIEIGSV